MADHQPVLIFVCIRRTRDTQNFTWGCTWGPQNSPFGIRPDTQHAHSITFGNGTLERRTSWPFPRQATYTCLQS